MLQHAASDKKERSSQARAQPVMPIRPSRSIRAESCLTAVQHSNLVMEKAAIHLSYPCAIPIALKPRGLRPQHAAEEL
jgi:hypothetical protein